MADDEAQPEGIVARTAGEEAAAAAEARGGFRTPPKRPDPTADSLDRALAMAQIDEAQGGTVRLDERDVAADLGAVDPAAVPSVQRPDGAPGFTEQFAGARLTGIDEEAPNRGPFGLTVAADAPVTTAKLRTAPPRRNPTSGRILTEADRIIHSDRAEAYGPAEDSFDRIAAFWTTHLRDKLKPGATVDAYDVALLMVLMKVSRGATDVKDDTFVDIAGYGALAARLAIFTGRGTPG